MHVLALPFVANPFASKQTQRVVALLVALLMTVVVGSSAVVDSDRGGSANPAGAVSSVATDMAEGAARLAGFVVRQADGTFALPVTAKAGGVASSTYDALVAGMEATNDMVRRGLLATTAELDVFETGSSVFSPQSTYSAWYWRWWGVEVHLSAYWTNKVVSGLAAGAALATIAAIITSATGVGGVAASLAAAVLALGSAVVQFCSNSRGVVLKRTHSGAAWCHGH